MNQATCELNTICHYKSQRVLHKGMGVRISKNLQFRKGSLHPFQAIVFRVSKIRPVS